MAYSNFAKLKEVQDLLAKKDELGKPETVPSIEENTTESPVDTSLSNPEIEENVLKPQISSEEIKPKKDILSDLLNKKEELKYTPVGNTYNEMELEKAKKVEEIDNVVKNTTRSDNASTTPSKVEQVKQANIADLEKKVSKEKLMPSDDEILKKINYSMGMGIGPNTAVDFAKDVYMNGMNAKPRAMEWAKKYFTGKNLEAMLVSDEKTPSQSPVEVKVDPSKSVPPTTGVASLKATTEEPKKEEPKAETPEEKEQREEKEGYNRAVMMDVFGKLAKGFLDFAALRATANPAGYMAGSKLTPMSASGAISVDNVDKYLKTKAERDKLKLEREKLGATAADKKADREMRERMHDEKINATLKAARIKASDSGVKLSKAQEAADKAYAKEYVKFKSESEPRLQTQVDTLEDMYKELEDNPGMMTGTLDEFTEKALGGFGRSVTNPKLQGLKDRLDSIIQGGLRETLGAQFTEKEGENFLKREFNPKLGPEENLKRMKNFINKVNAQFEAKRKLASHYEEHGTIEGLNSTSKLERTPKSQGQLPSDVEEKINNFMKKNGISDKDEAIKILKENKKI